MRNTPSIEELNQTEKFELLASVSHSRIKDFVLNQVMEDRRIIPYYMVYQTLLFLSALFFFTRSFVLAFRGETSYLYVSLAAIAFSLTFLVVIHELLHGLVLKITGAPEVRFGMVPGKFIFYAEANSYVLGRKSFLWVALTPLIGVQIATIVLIVLWMDQPFVYFPLLVMCIHSFFCAGDIALVSLFYRFSGRRVYTYDNREEKTSYYFVETESPNSI
jgi:hypothetical protein